VLRTISKGVGSADALAFDASGDLYVGSLSGSVTSYAAGTKKLKLTITAGITAPDALAFDGLDNLYVASNQFSSTDTVTVYTGKKLILTIQGVDGPSALAFDSSGDLYVANCGDCGQGGPTTKYSVQVYAPDSSAVLRTISKGLSTPFSLAFDKSGDLFVGNSGSVTEYDQEKKLKRTITSGVNSARAVAVDASNNLYVANNGLNTVTVYSPKGKLLRTISSGLAGPQALAIDGSGNLYVANCNGCQTGNYGPDSITVYAPGSTTPSETITNGVNFPMALAFGP
jgi:sugar lactone lactonase YvrE